MSIEVESGTLSPEEVLSRLQQLEITLDPAISYRLDTLFPRLQGWGAKSEIRAKAKVVQRVEPLLRQMLHPGESVHYIARGAQYSFLEQLFMGVWAYSINQTVFVLTNLRLIMIRTGTSGRPKETRWQVYYSQIAQFKSSWTGTLTLKLRDGHKLTFTGFPKHDRQRMPAVFEQALDKYRELGFDPVVDQSLEDVCCTCHACVGRQQYACSGCGTEFWKPSELAVRSFVIPSWGDLLMKHHLVAVIELIGGVFTWLVVASLVAISITNGDPVALVCAAILLFMAHGIDAAITYAVARKGLYPKRRGQVPLPASE
jgi:hypothetical protein